MSTARTASRAARTLVPPRELHRVRMSPWQAMSVWMRGATRDDGKVLGVIVQPDGPVLALESDDPTASLQGILGGHAHAVVLEQPQSLTQAIDAAELYLSRWLHHELAEHEKCGCGEIGAKPAATTKTGSKSRTRT